MGELQALTWADLSPQPSPDRILIRHRWDRKFGLKGSKSGKERVVPLPQALAQVLQELGEGKPARGFIFLNTTDSGPIQERFLADGFHGALTKFGISKADRKARCVTFHSWRHFFNTTLRRAGIQDAKVQLVIGHSSTEMSDHYTHFDIADLKVSHILSCHDVICGVNVCRRSWTESVATIFWNWLTSDEPWS